MFLTSCSAQNKILKGAIPQFEYRKQLTFKNDTLFFFVENPLNSPLRLQVFSGYLKEKGLINDTLHLILKEKADTTIAIYAKGIEVQKIKLKINQALGDTNNLITKNNLALPFPKNKIYKVVQGYEGAFSHQTEYSRYSIDFNLKEGDTVLAADDGYVVGIVKDYINGGNSKKWEDYANFITIYHPQSGLYTQYVHLKPNGNLVNMGAFVKRNEPIALSGLTGYLSGPHLHFNVLIPEKDKTLISTPIIFENNRIGSDLKKGMTIKK